MALELLETTANGNAGDKETLYMLGGVAMIVFGAGLILSNPFVRRYMSQMGVGNLAERCHARYPAIFQTAGDVGAEAEITAWPRLRLPLRKRWRLRRTAT